MTKLELVERPTTYRVCKTTSPYRHYRNGITYYVAPHFYSRERGAEILAEGLSYAEAAALCELLKQSEGA